jgi:hypothetical protein
LSPRLSSQLLSNVTATTRARRWVTACKSPSKSMYVRLRSLSRQ